MAAAFAAGSSRRSPRAVSGDYLTPVGFLALSLVRTRRAWPRPASALRPEAARRVLGAVHPHRRVKNAPGPRAV